MKLVYAFLGLVLSMFGAVHECAAENGLAGQRVAALRGLHSASVVYRLNAPKELVSHRELNDMVEVGLARNVPRLRLMDPANSSTAWLEVSLITTEAGLVVTLTLRRWVTVRDTKEEVFSPVWTDVRASFGNTSRTALQESLDALFTGFGADYVRANKSIAQ